MHCHHLNNLLVKQIENFINMSNWYIGQEIVAIKDHPQGRFKDGQIFTIHGLRNSICKCKNVEIDISIRDARTGTIETCCIRCNTSFMETNNICWFSENRFAPLDSFVNHEELNEIKQNLNLEPIWKN